LFPDHTRLFVYPEIDSNGELNDLTKVSVPDNLHHLYLHLLENGFIQGVNCSDHKLFEIYSREILNQISLGLGEWQNLLPEGVAEAIVKNKLFGFRG